MKRFFLISLLLGAFVLLGTSEAQHRREIVSTGEAALMDSITWSNGQGLGAGGYICTLYSTSDLDTSTQIRLANIKSFGAIVAWSNAQSQGGGDHTVSCSLQVSISGDEWMVPDNMVVWSTTSSSDPAEADMKVYVAPAMSDSTHDSGVAGPGLQAYLQSARYARFVLAQSSGTYNRTGTGDTTFVKIQTFKQYYPVR